MEGNVLYLEYMYGPNEMSGRGGNAAIRLKDGRTVLVTVWMNYDTGKHVFAKRLAGPEDMEKVKKIMALFRCRVQYRVEGDYRIFDHNHVVDWVEDAFFHLLEDVLEVA